MKINIFVVSVFLCFAVGLSQQYSASTDQEYNEIDDRIVIKEPYKSIIQSTVKIALSQTKIPDHVNIDTAMNIVNRAGGQLSRPKVLQRVLKGITVIAASILVTTFLFPGAYKFLDSAIQDPIKVFNLNKYFDPNGIQERTITNLISTQTDDFLNKVGLRSSCRPKSICYLGELTRCIMPEASEAILKFSDENLSNSILKGNKYFETFMTGFRDEKCNSVEQTERSSDCLADFVRTVFGKPRNQKFQTIHANASRA